MVPHGRDLFVCAECTMSYHIAMIVSQYPVCPSTNSAPGSALPACYLLTADLVEISLFLVCNLVMLAPLTFHHWARLLRCTTRFVLLSAYCAYLSPSWASMRNILAQTEVSAPAIILITTLCRSIHYYLFSSFLTLQSLR